MQIAALDDWRRCLRELECSEKLTEQIMKMIETQNADRAIALLRHHKRVLLEELHRAEKKVDLLDFLLYQLKNGKVERK
jgi:hypothetical protein